MAGFFEHSNEISDAIKWGGGQFLNQLRNFYFLKKYSGPWS